MQRRKHRGVVLMMTLILITLLMGVVSIALSQTTHITRIGNKPFLENTSLVTLYDLENILPSLLSSVTGPEELDIALKIPLQIETRDGDFRLTAKLKSDCNRLNINNLVDSNGKIDNDTYNLFLQLFLRYPIREPDIFFKLVYDTIDLDLAEKGPQTEIALQDPDYKNGALYNQKQFDRLLEQYVLLTRDKSILAIKWEKYIRFRGGKMDFNSVTPEILSLLLPNVSPEKIRLLTRSRIKTFLSKDEAVSVEPSLGSLFDKFFFIYQTNASYDMACDVTLFQQAETQHILFDYNLAEKKIQRVRFL